MKQWIVLHMQEKLSLMVTGSNGVTMRHNFWTEIRLLNSLYRVLMSSIGILAADIHFGAKYA